MTSRVRHRGLVALIAALVASTLVVVSDVRPAAASHEGVWGPVLVGYTNHVHTSTSDDPPAVQETRVIRERGPRVLVGGIHYNPWRRNRDWALSTTTCWATADQVRSGHYNCNPAHSLYGYTWLGPGPPHRTEPIYEDTWVTRFEKYTVPVNHLHPVYEYRCIANCGHVAPPPSVPPTSAPSHVTVPPVPAGPITVTVDSFRQGQTGGSLASDQVIKVSGSALTCEGHAAPCGPTPGSTASGTYGPIAMTLQASMTLTAPSGFERGADPSSDDYHVTSAYPSSANLWDGPAAQRQRFFTSTPNGATYRIVVSATARVRYISWGCDFDCSLPEHRWETSTTVTVPTTVVYRPNADGRFAVVGANVRS